MRRNHNTRRIIGSRYYEFSDVAKLYGVHIRTVQRWHKLGLNVVNESSRPFLVLGSELRRFLEHQKSALKHPLTAGCFYCLKCREERTGVLSTIEKIRTGKRVGLNSKQIVIKGICEICGTKLVRFSTDHKEDNHDK